VTENWTRHRERGGAVLIKLPAFLSLRIGRRSTPRVTLSTMMQLRIVFFVDYVKETTYTAYALKSSPIHRSVGVAGCQ
jgi:hypothetical protein